MGFPLDHATPAEWARLVEQDPISLLEDHAHCELKAAASAHALIAKNPERTELVRDLADIAATHASSRRHRLPTLRH